MDGVRTPDFNRDDQGFSSDGRKVVLNVTPNHMDRYESLTDYAAAKHRIFRIKLRLTSQC